MNSQGSNITGSCWNMDADEDFATGPIYTAKDITSYTAGELQNDYSQCFGYEEQGNILSAMFSKVAWTGSDAPTIPSDPDVHGATGCYMPPWTAEGTAAPRFLLWGAFVSQSFNFGGPPTDVSASGIDYPNGIFNNIPIKREWGMGATEDIGFMISAWIKPLSHGSSFSEWSDTSGQRQFVEPQSIFAPTPPFTGGDLNYRNCRYTIVSFANQNPIFSGSGINEAGAYDGNAPFQLPGTCSLNVFLETYTQQPSQATFNSGKFRLTAEALIGIDDGVTPFMDSASTAYIIPADEWSHILFSYGPPNGRPDWGPKNRFGFFVNGVYEPIKARPDEWVPETSNLDDHPDAYFGFVTGGDSWSCPGTGAIGIDASYARESICNAHWMLTGTANQSAFMGFMDEISIYPYSIQNTFNFTPDTSEFAGVASWFYNNGCPTAVGDYLLAISQTPLFQNQGFSSGILSPAAWYHCGDLTNDSTGIPYDHSGSAVWDWSALGLGGCCWTGSIGNRMGLDTPQWPSLTGSLYKNHSYESHNDFYGVAGDLYAWPGMEDVSLTDPAVPDTCDWGRNRGWIQFTSSVPCDAIVIPKKEDLRLGALYNLKHTIPSVFSTMQFGWGGLIGSGNLPAVSRSITMPIPEVADVAASWYSGWTTSPSPSSALRNIQYPLGKIDTCGGNALWEVGPMAGYTKDGAFVNQSRSPAYNTYADYARFLKLKNQKYSIVPEFRMEDFMYFYEIENGGNYLVPNPGEFSIWGIPTGAAGRNPPANSSEPAFFTIYSNSDLPQNLSMMISDNKGTADPTTITLTCNAMMKFLPYDGLYPSERLTECAHAFSKSFGDFVTYLGADDYLTDIRMRPFLNPFYRPGIIFNSMKAGLACNYPVHQGSWQRINYVGLTLSNDVPYYTKYYAVGTRSHLTESSAKGTKWDYLVPFEAAVEPEKYISNMPLSDMEPNPDAALDVTAMWDGNGNILHKLIISNFLAETADFFLKDESFSTIKSAPENQFQAVTGGVSYGCRVRNYRSTKGNRVWRSKLVDLPINNFSLPQDPINILGISREFKEDFTMYSRYSAFGPPAAATYDLGIFASSVGTAEQRLFYRTKMFPSDCLSGLYPHVTPGFMGGESHADIIFTPTRDGIPTLDEIFSNSTVQQWRIDAYAASGAAVGGTLGPEFLTLESNRRQAYWNGDDDPDTYRTPFDAFNANNYAMQLDASFNLFAVEKKSWALQTKWESPMLNFNSSRTMPMDLTIPTFGSESVPRGMWHQAGQIESDKGVFMAVEDIPPLWLESLQYREDPQLEFSYYDIEAYGADATQLRSLSDVVGFSSTPRRLGQLPDTKIISEAVVAIPFVEEDNQRKFFRIPEPIIGQILGKTGQTTGASRAALAVRTAYEGLLPLMDEMLDSEGAKQDALAGLFGPVAAPAISDAYAESKTTEYLPTKSIVDMVEKMKKYVFPPRLDFVSNFGSVDPFAMYIFEFETKLSQQDVANLWQGILPDIGESFVTQKSSIAHKLLADELMGNFGKGAYKPLHDRLQWMVFKVKKRAKNNYFGKVIKEGGEKAAERPYSYNWPYDHFSLVEFANLGVEVGIGKAPDTEDTLSTAQSKAHLNEEMIKVAIVSEKPMPTNPQVQIKENREQTSEEKRETKQEKRKEKRKEKQERGKLRGKKKK